MESINIRRQNNELKIQKDKVKMHKIQEIENFEILGWRKLD